MSAERCAFSENPLMRKSADEVQQRLDFQIFVRLVLKLIGKFPSVGNVGNIGISVVAKTAVCAEFSAKHNDVLAE